MKKIIFAILIFAGFSATAQSTSPRWGTTAGGDNTARTLTYAYQTVTDASGNDSKTLNPNAYYTVVRVALTDSVTFASPTVTRSYAGDNLTIIASGASGTKVKFGSSNFISAGTATISSGGRSVIKFVFDGAKWVECGRVTQ